MNLRGLAVAMLAACGGGHATTPPVSTPSAPASCTERWLTIDRDIIDLDVAADRVVWLEREHGRIAAMSREGGAEKELRAPAAKPEYGHEMALAGDRIVWANSDGGVWTLGANGAPASIGKVPKPMAVEATRDLVVVASEDGVFGLTFNGDMQRLYARDAWVMTLDGTAAYVQANTMSGNPSSAILRVPLDGSEPTMLAPEEIGVISILVHDGRVLYTTHHGVFEAVGGAIKPIVQMPGMEFTANLRAVGDRIYFTRDNVIYQLRGTQAVPVGVASETIGDLEVDGSTFYAVTREYKGVKVLCIAPDAPAVTLATPDPEKRKCLAGEEARVTQFGSTECVDPASGDRKYSIGFHGSGTPFEEYARDGITRTWYADGTLRDERPIKGAGVEKRYYVNGKLHEEGPHDADGENDGTWKEYGPDGTLRATTEWAHGVQK